MQLKSSFLGFALFALTSVACSSSTPAADDGGNPSGGDAAITPDGATSADSASDAPITLADGATDAPITTGDADVDSATTDSGLDGATD
jgi:hypothetical protein